MDWPLLLSSTLIALGALIMLVNIFSHSHWVRSANIDKRNQTAQTKLLIKTHMIFMVFFFLGYLCVLYMFLKRIEFASSLFVAIIFFFGAIFVFMGIVIQGRMQEALRLKNHELAQFNNQLKAEQDKLVNLNTCLENEIANRVIAEEADKMKSDFLSLVSHELRTPLTSIFGFTKLLEKRVSNMATSDAAPSLLIEKKRISDNLHIISDECCRLTRLINNVLDLSKLESGRVDWKDEPTELKRIMESAIAALEGVLHDKHNVTLRTQYSDGLPTINVDIDMFTQVFINLLSNALKFTPKGIITVSAFMESDQIHITISDEGDGINENDLENIFDKFYIVRSGDTLGDKKQGTGLGLPISREIIEHYSGRIWAESTVGRGSTFHIVLPKDIIVA